jgi:hypothetical protein
VVFWNTKDTGRGVVEGLAGQTYCNQAVELGTVALTQTARDRDTNSERRSFLKFIC